MRFSSILVVTLLLLALPASADQAACPAIATEGAQGLLLAAPASVELASDRSVGGAEATCSATADCGSAPDVSCTYTGSSGSCSFADRSCPGQRGFVTCGSTTKYCPPCGCVNGSKRHIPTGLCCGPLEVYREEVCINNIWEANGNWICDGSCPGGGLLD